MFADIISRDEGEPWGETGMTSQKWQEVPARSFLISDLIATQPGVLLHALAEDHQGSHSGDHLAHVVEWEGRFYLEDGHHRAVRARLNGSPRLLARHLVVQ
ncbi:hypothetical protein SEA_SONALI_83 [Arthrobacter phage Sonali]|uniref:Uncharacterized protein n=1 Tax=Arthrobacter phage Sonali TaxID=2510495 RepID=A0A411CQJ6_9CAUD|nr:hypothetical protein HOV09_gp83 [Arthrobacter phage Sonali]QAY16195.1 hypothetical protein SEA_SONALI_83 [Arthrobacter phage Sonali]